MKLATVCVGAKQRVGVLVGNNVLEPYRVPRMSLPPTLAELVASRALVQRVSDLVEGKGEDEEFIRRFSTPLEKAQLMAPLPTPGKVICLGLNYRDHAEETGKEPPPEPVVFAKASTSVVGPGQNIMLPAVSDKVDYEVELAFVIGEGGKNIRAPDAMNHVAGYTVLNDVSARDYQHEKPGGQWLLGKSFDTFCPLGPWLVTSDEITDPHALGLRCLLNGELVQSSNTGQMIFRIPQIIEYISAVFTLLPGDVVGTGTPAGVGAARTPPRFLRAGDTVSCQVEKIGSLENSVVEA